MSSYKYLGWFAASIVVFEFATYACNDMILPAMPSIVRDFGGSLHHIPLSMSLYILGCAAFQLFAAPLADYFGQRHTLLLGTLYFIGTTFLILLSESITTFLSLRFVAGASMAFSSLGYALIHKLYDDQRAAKVTSLMHNFTIISPVAGPMIGIFILKGFSWHYIFIFCAILGMISWLGIKLTLPKIPRPKTKLNLKQLTRGYLQLLSHPTYRIGLCACLSMTLPYLIWIALSTTVIKEKLGLDDGHYIILQLLALGGALFSTVAIHLFAGRISFSKLMSLGILLAIIGLSIGIFYTDNIDKIAIGMLIYGVGSGLFNALAIRIIGTIPFYNTNMIFTLFTFVQLIGFFIGISLAERLFSMNDYAPNSFSLLNAVIIWFIILFGSIFIWRNRNRQWT